MRKMLLILSLLLWAINGWCQMPTDVKCMTLMDVPLEGTDTVFIPALQSAGFQQVTSPSDDPDTYYFKGEFYGIKDAKLMVSVNEKTKLLTDVTVKNDHSAVIDVINDYGSEDFTALLTLDGEGNITMKHQEGSTYKIVVKNKYVKIPSKIVLKPVK